MGTMTGRCKRKGGRLFRQVRFHWTEADNAAFKEYWGYDRPANESTYCRWIADRQLERW